MNGDIFVVSYCGTLAGLATYSLAAIAVSKARDYLLRRTLQNLLRKHVGTLTTAVQMARLSQTFRGQNQTLN